MSGAGNENIHSLNVPLPAHLSIIKFPYVFVSAALVRGGRREKSHMKEYEVEFLIDGVSVGSSTLWVHNGKLDDSAATDDFFRILRRNEKSLIADAEDEERSTLVDTLTSEQEEKLKEVHASTYHGTDDDMSDDYETWLEDLSLAELKELIK